MKTYLLFARTLCTALVLTGALVSLTPGAYAQATAEKQMAKTASASAAGFNDADKKLIMAAAESDEAEITLAKLALEKTSSAKIKEYAQMMIADHGKSTQMLKPIAHAAGVSMPDLKAKHKAMSAGLETLSGSAFDKAYVKGNVKSHSEILTTMKKSMDDISNPELKKFAATVTPIIEHHLMMAKDMDKGM
jgi:putative membrane protein